MFVPLTIVIATANRAQSLERTLTSLSQAQIPENCRTIVVENSRSNVSKAVSEKISQSLRLSHIFFPCENKSLALNRALARIKDGLVVFFDDDVEISPTTLVNY